MTRLAFSIPVPTPGTRSRGGVNQTSISTWMQQLAPPGVQEERTGTPRAALVVSLNPRGSGAPAQAEPMGTALL